MILFHQVFQEIRVVGDFVVVDLELKRVGLFQHRVDQSVFERIGFQIGRGNRDAVVQNLSIETCMR